MESAWTPASWFSRINDTYSMLWKMVIRPPRDLYAPEELGPAKFRLGKRVYERKDLQLTSTRGVLECSHFVPAKAPQAKRPCVVYLHGNCSSRLEAFDALPVLLPRDLTVFCLDLSGSGRSEGEYISLGHWEEKDLRVVLQHLRDLGTVSSIGLWGRSMGATTSILRAAQDGELAACVLDSAFGDLRTVAEELVNRGRFKVPNFLVNMAFEMIRTEVLTRASFDPAELVPIRSAPRAVCPALFGVAADDSFVLPHHTQDLHNAWAGERVLRVFDGGHNGVRPGWFLEEAADFLVDHLKRSSPGKKGRRDTPAAAGAKAKRDTTGPSGKVGPGPELLSTSEAEIEEEEDASAAAAVAAAASAATSGGGSASTPVTTPRLAPPWAPTERSPSDADVAAGGAPVDGDGRTGAASEEDLARRKRQLAAELMRMGFGAEVSAKAAARTGSLEEALDWLLKKSDVLCTLSAVPPEGRQAPTAEGFTNGGTANGGIFSSGAAGSGAWWGKPNSSKAAVPTHKQVSPAAADRQDSFANLPSLIFPGATLEEQLRHLGFDHVKSRSAARNCQDLEAAAEFLAAQNATVAL